MNSFQVHSLLVTKRAVRGTITRHGVPAMLLSNTMRLDASLRALSTSILGGNHSASMFESLNNRSFAQTSRRYYTPMTKEEEEQEKARVSHLSKEEKDQELRKLNRKIAKLEMLRGINTGELYTWSGRYKALMRDYGFPLFVYYWCVWSVMGVSVYLAIDVGGLDAMELLARIDHPFGWSLTEKVDPQLGKIGLVLMINELLEPVRLPFVITTLKPAMDTISPPKY